MTSRFFQLVLFLLLLPFYGFAGDCNFACDHIPPMDESLIQYGVPQERSLDPNNIRIFNWNIYKSRMPGWREDFVGFAEQSDIMIVQEVFINNVMSQALFQLNHFHMGLAVSFLMKEILPTGVGTFSRVAPSQILPQRTTDREPFVKSPKMNLVTKYPLTGREETLLVINIHGLNATNTKSYLRQLELTREVIANHRGPAVFGGDFNTRNRSRRKKTNRFMEEFGFQQVLWHEDSRLNPLDHIYIKGVTLKESQLLLRETSDHPAFYVEVSVP